MRKTYIYRKGKAVDAHPVVSLAGRNLGRQLVPVSAYMLNFIVPLPPGDNSALLLRQELEQRLYGRHSH